MARLSGRLWGTAPFLPALGGLSHISPRTETPLHPPALRGLRSEHSPCPRGLGRTHRLRGSPRDHPGQSRHPRDSGCQFWSPLAPGPPCTPGTEPDALKICPDLGKAWPGKKPQGFVPVQVDQTLQEQGMQRVCPGAVRKDRRSPTPLCWTPFQGSALFPPPRKSGMERWAWGQRLCCPAGLAWGRSHLRASDRCSSTASEPFDASQDTGNWGLGPPEISHPPKGFPCSP